MRDKLLNAKPSWISFHVCVYVYVVYLTTLFSRSDRIATNERMIVEL
jgi:hypothetical protein